ncbi:MAG: hypothetical protein QF599_00135 [Planctomycetota bacterium]|jgi:hypothetical protein|nr:hypothetical protein [Planctomycetota bacterium]
MMSYKELDEELNTLVRQGLAEMFSEVVDMAVDKVEFDDGAHQFYIAAAAAKTATLAKSISESFLASIDGAAREDISRVFKNMGDR